MTATCATCGEARTFPTLKTASTWLWEHDESHRGIASEVVQMPSVDWHTQARTALLTLCRSGRPFVVSEVIELGVPDAPAPRTDWPRVTNEMQAEGFMVPTGRLGHSVRPKTKGSPVTEWQGTVKAKGAAA